jgi:hypothetical protein
MPMLDNSQSPSTPNAPAVVVGDPNQRMTDGQSLPSQLAGRQGDQYVSEIHGKYYTQSYRGKTFIAGTGIAGSVIPLAPPVSQAQTALSLWNPAGSGKMIELIRLSIGAVSATTAVIGSLVWAADFNQIQPTGTPTAPATLSANPLTSVPTNLTGQNPTGQALGSSCFCYATCTTQAAVSAYFMARLTFGAVTDAPGPALSTVWYDGSILVPPGTLIALNSTVAQSANFLQEIM